MTDNTANIELEADETHIGIRLDKALADHCADLSRARVQNLIDASHVRVNDQICTQASRKLKGGEQIAMHVPAPVAATPKPEDIPLDITYEDEHLLVINKPAGLVVHPGAGNQDGTLVNALLHHCGTSLSGIGGVMRPGIVHRLDKDTSGLMAVAKNDKAHQGLSDQLQERSLSRTYLTLVTSVPIPPLGAIDKPIGRHTHNRLKMSIQLKTGRASKTHYKTVRNYNDAVSLVQCKLESGRTHQIRVHMEAIKHYVIGDPFYGAQPTLVKSLLGKGGYEDETIAQILDFPRQALHAHEIGFIHPITEERLSFTAEPPQDFQNLIKLLESEA